ncbi:MAG: MMPL family transporter [Desulfobacteraceae bacterium]|nr:MMPL family transporter [Desulfobacteraceae bacterium]MBC2755811.1 MMPL family transporter [Desulfobacteraceae bacterium]
MISFLEKIIFWRRSLILVFFAVTTVFMGYSSSKLYIDAGFSKLLPLEHEYMKTYLDHKESFGGGNRIIIALVAKDGDIYTPEFFSALKGATDEVFFLPGVERSKVKSLFTANVRYVEVTEDGVDAGNVIPADFQPTPEGLERVRQNVLKSGIVGRLVANDFSGAIISAGLLDMDPNTGKKLNYLKVSRDLEEKVRAKFQTEKIDVHIIGFAKVIGDMAKGAKRVVIFFGIAFLITALMVYLYSMSFWRTAAVLCSATTAVVWQLGLLPILGFGIDPMGILVPFLIFAIAVSHSVQMVSATGSELYNGATPLEAAHAGFRRLLVPSVTALITDTIGFLTIYLIPVRIIQEVALTASIGVAVIIVVNGMLLPVLISFPPTSEKYRRKLHRRAKRLAPVWRFLSRCAERKVAAAIVMVVLCLTIFGAWKGAGVKIGDLHQGVPEFRPDSRYNLDTAAITDRFSIGVDSISVIVETVAFGCLDYEAMSDIDEFAWYMQNVEGVVSVVTLPYIAKRMNSRWHEGNPKWKELPRGREEIMTATSNVRMKSGMLNKDCSVMPVKMFTSDHTAETIDRITSEVKNYIAANPSDKVKFRLATGNVGIMAATNEEVQARQFPILFCVFGAVILFCLIAFRSIRAVLIILLPLGLVSLLAYALMNFLDIGLKVNTLPVVALGVGVGVDYSIYIYGQLRSLIQEGMPLREAYELTLDITGNAVMLTGITLAIAVGTWIFSPLQFQADMGILLTFLFLMNMIGAVIVLPAMAYWLLKKNTVETV